MKILDFICEIIITILVIYITVIFAHFLHDLHIKVDQKYKKYQYTQIFNKYKGGKSEFKNFY